MKWNPKEPLNGLVSQPIRDNFKALDKLKYSGWGKFNSTTGVEITFDYNSLPNLLDGGYVVFVSPIMENGDTVPVLGQVWVSDKTQRGFTVYCSEADTATMFLWTIGVNN